MIDRKWINKSFDSRSIASSHLSNKNVNICWFHLFHEVLLFWINLYVFWTVGQNKISEDVTLDSERLRRTFFIIFLQLIIIHLLCRLLMRHINNYYTSPELSLLTYCSDQKPLLTTFNNISELTRWNIVYFTPGEGPGTESVIKSVQVINSVRDLLDFFVVKNLEKRLKFFFFSFVGLSVSVSGWCFRILGWNVVEQ